MVRSSRTQPDALLGWMDALADPTRLRALRLLERHELGVVELCDVLQLPQSTVSRHLKVLLERGWVRHRSQGTTHFYRMILDELEPASRRLWLLAREQTDAWATVRQDNLRLARRLRERSDINTRDFFAGTAGKWDKLRRELYGERFNFDALLALLPREYVVADLGCGTGHLATELAGCVGRVIGIDDSPAMLKAAHKRTAGLENVELRAGDLAALPIESESCDAALLVLVLSYLTDPSPVIGEAARILKPGGRLVVVDLLPHDRDDFRRQMEQKHAGFDANAVEGLAAGAGLRDLRLRALPPGENTRGPALFLATAAKR